MARCERCAHSEAAHGDGLACRFTRCHCEAYRPSRATWFRVYPFWAYPTSKTKPAHRVYAQSDTGRAQTECGAPMYSAPLVVIERANEAATPEQHKCQPCVRLGSISDLRNA